MHYLRLKSQRGTRADRRHRPARVEGWAIGAAALGVVAACLLDPADPPLWVLCLGALGALIANLRGDRRVQATLAARLLLSLVYLAAGIRHPTPLGLPLIVFGASLGALALRTSQQAVRREKLLVRLTLKIRCPAAGEASIVVPAGASTSHAARKAASALALHEPVTCRLQRDGVELDLYRSLLANGIRRGDALTLLIDPPGSRGQHMNVPSYGEVLVAPAGARASNESEVSSL